MKFDEIAQPAYQAEFFLSVWVSWFTPVGGGPASCL